MVLNIISKSLVTSIIEGFFRVSLWFSILGIIALITDFGFYQNLYYQKVIDGFYFIVLGVGIISTFTRYILFKNLFRRKVVVFDVISIGFTLWIYYMYLFVGVPFETDLLLENPIWIRIALVFSFIREFSEVRFNYKRTLLNPAQLFIASFLSIIIFGAALLKLPGSTFEGISVIDALFTSASAVCVTGLIVVDTATYFTNFGQIIIISLIQIGGLEF